jgi:hypothetical protein
MEEQINIPPVQPEFEMDNLPPQFEDELPSQIPPALETPMNEEQLTESEELLSLAKGEAVKLGGFWTPTIFEEAARSVIDSVRLEEESIRRATLVEAASNPNVSVQARTELVRAIANDRTFDNNMIERAALTRLAEAEAEGLPSDMADEIISQAMQEVESIPKYAVPETGAAVGWTPNALTLSGYDIGESIRRLRANSDMRTQAGDVIGQLVPYKEQLLVMDIAAAAGIDTRLTDKGTAANTALTSGLAFFGPGSTIREIARHLELDAIDAGLIPDANGKLALGTDEAKIDVRQRITNVLNILKSNSGVFADVNHATIAYMLENVFPFFTTGEYANEQLQRFAEDRSLDELYQRKREIQNVLDLGDVGSRSYAEAELADVEEQIKNHLSFGRAFERNMANIPVMRHIPIPDITFNEFFSNMAAIDDLLLGPDIIRATVGLSRASYRLLRNKFVRANAVAPSVTAQNVASTLTTGQPTRITVGNEPADILDSVLPSVAERSWVKTNVNAGVLLEEADEELALLAMEQTNRLILNDAERSKAASQIVQRLGTNTTARPAALQLGNSTITPKIVNGEDGVEVAGVFGKTEADAFSSADEARRAAMSLFGTKAKFNVLRYSDEGAGKLVPAGGERDGKFYFSIRTDIPYETVTDYNQWLGIGNKAITPGFANKLWWSMRAGTFQPLSNKSSTFDKFWNLAINPSDDRSRALARTFGQRFDEAIEKAGGQQFELNQLLRKFEGRGGKISRADLEEAGMQMGFKVGEELEDAFRLYRRGTDIIYTVADRYATRLKMLEGAEEVWSETARLGFGKRVGEATGPRTVFDTATGTTVRMSKDDINNAVGKGAVLMELDDALKDGGAKFALVQGKGSVRPLSGNVLPYIPGYITEVVASQYSIIGTRADGTRALLGVAANRADAEKVVGQMKADPKRYGAYSIGINLENSAANLGQIGLATKNTQESLGGAVFGQRNMEKVINGSPDINPDIYLDPISAAMRAIDAASYTLTKGDMMRQLSQRMLTTINQSTKLNIAVLDDEAVKTLRDRGHDDLADQAKAILAQAKVSNGMADPLNIVAEAVFVRLEKALANTAAYIASKHATSGNKFARTRLAIATEKGLANQFRLAQTFAADAATAGGWNVLNGLMRLSHIAGVSSAVTVQLALQGAQPLLLTGLAPASLAKAYALQALMLTTFSSRRFGKGVFEKSFKRLEPFTKAIGLEKGELDFLFKRMEDWGIYDAVQVDTRLRSQVRSQAGQYALRSAERHKASVLGGVGRRRAVKVKNVISATAEGALRVAETPFMESENINQTITFMALYLKDKSAGVANLKSRAYVDSLAGRVRELTGAMTPENSFGFQRGLFKTMFQFASFPWKMTKLILPEFAGGNRAIEAREKAGMVSAQFLLYGAAGLPLGTYAVNAFNTAVLENAPIDPEQRSLFERTWMSPEVQAMVNGLFVETFINEAIKSITNNDETNLEISERFAPLGGTEFALTSFLAPILNPDNKAPIDLFLSSPGVKATQVYEVIKDAGNLALADWNDIDQIDYGLRAQWIVEKGLTTMVAQYRTEYLLRLHDNLGGHASRGGNVSQETMTDIERIAFRLFRIETKDRAEFFRLRSEYTDRKMNDPAEAREAEAQEYANKYFDMLLDFNRMRHEEKLPADRISLLQNEWIEQQIYLKSVIFEDDPEMEKKVGELIATKVLQAIENAENGTADTNEARLVQTIIDNMKNGAMGDHKLAVQRIINGSMASDEQKAMVMDAWMKYVEEEGEE